MSSATFDTLGYFEKLKAAGVPEEQAKAQIDVIRQIIDDKLATRRDLKELELTIKQEIKDVRTELKELEYRLTIRLGGMMAASIAIVAALVKLT
jgi:hypothetical protein